MSKSSSSKQKKSGRSERSGRSHRVEDDQSWSEQPVFDQDTNQWYVWRQTSTGRTEYQLYNPADDRTPRTEVDNVTQGFENLNVSQGVPYSAYPQETQSGYQNPVAEVPEYSTSEVYTTEPRGYRSEKGKYKTSEDQPASTSSHRDKGKSKARTDLDPSATSAGSGQGYVDQPQAYGGNAEWAQTIQETQHEAYPGVSSGEPSQYAAHSAYSSTTSPYQDTYPAEGEQWGTNQEEAAQSGEVIRGTPGDYEEVDPRYRVEPSWRFDPGSVFKILWSEPLGQSKATLNPAVSDIREDDLKRFYIGYRRFIIVATDEGHSTCVPILTYEHKGCKKKGVHPSKHGIVYAKGSKPRLLKDEPNLGYDPVAVKMSAEEETLAKESRVNYSKLVTIEHNVKVYFIGTVDSKDFPICQYAVNDSWEKKWHQSSKKSRNDDRQGHSHGHGHGKGRH